eukprot:CAMPEP_0194504180 /NCGR_PEP_ID=MMETSP0253-20130528/28804_1 /TAXON_ID=2966 /ORGANISM="Noctiluca scintillans" /LENGTH=78 /DNA_ID=CAMNT_0039346549 /DNA_START=66 /DNA_END=299 /DNA_ORIENTATION=-
MDGHGLLHSAVFTSSDFSMAAWLPSWAEVEDVSSTSFPNQGFPVDDWEGDHESFDFANDFYGEIDDVTRNVNIDSVAF